MVDMAHLAKEEGECCILADNMSTNCHSHAAFVQTQGVNRKWVLHEETTVTTFLSLELPHPEELCHHGLEGVFRRDAVAFESPHMQ